MTTRYDTNMMVRKLTLVQLKEFDRKENILYIAMTYPEIEKASVIHAVELKNESSPPTANLASSTYKLASLLEEVKSKENEYHSIAKYIPSQFANMMVRKLTLVQQCTENFS